MAAVGRRYSPTVATGRGAVVVTGASTGIGFATARHLDSLGFTVFAGIRRAEDGERLASGASRRLRPLRIDVTDEASVAAAAEEVERESPDGVAGLVNNAGQSFPGPIEFQPLEDFRRQIEVNLIGQVAVIQRLLGQIRKGGGRIVNISSVGGRVTNPFLGAYAASKYGLEAVSDALRLELRPWGIWVALIEPGSIRTEIWRKGRETSTRALEKLPPEGHDLYGERMRAALAAAERLERLAIPPEKVAKLVEHALPAARPKARYVIGRDAWPLLAIDKLPERTADAAKARLAGI